jgi:hypothetical protein
MHIQWGNVPTWLAVTVATFGGYVALRQLRQQQKVIEGEIERNKARDALLDTQLREMQDRERSRQREQAERVDLAWDAYKPELARSLIVVTNESTRPIRDIAAVVHTSDKVPASVPLGCALMVPAPIGDVVAWTMPGQEHVYGHRRIDVLRAGDGAGFEMSLAPEALTGSEARVEFTDDAGYRWRLTHDLSLTLLGFTQPPALK